MTKLPMLRALYFLNCNHSESYQVNDVLGVSLMTSIPRLNSVFKLDMDFPCPTRK